MGVVPAREMFFQVGILDARLPPGGKRISDAQDDVAPPLAGVEDAGAIAEAAGFVAQIRGPGRLSDQAPAQTRWSPRLPAHTRPRSAPAFRPRCRECRSGTRCPRNFCATARATNLSHSSPAPTSKQALCRVPCCRSIPGWQPSAPGPANPASATPDCCRRPAQIREDFGFRVLGGFLDLSRTERIDEKTSGATDLYGGERRERNVFLQQHRQWFQYI